jgi:hypothetical protein
MFGAAALFDQRGKFAGLMTSQPFADGVAGAAELPGGGLEPVGAGLGDELLMQPMVVGAHAIEFKVGAVHAERMASFSRHRGVTMFPAFPIQKTLAG